MTKKSYYLYTYFVFERISAGHIGHLLVPVHCCHKTQIELPWREVSKHFYWLTIVTCVLQNFEDFLKLYL